MASENAEIDNNNKPVAMAVTDDSNLYRKMFRIDDTTKGLKVMLVGGTGIGTVTSVSVATANGFSGTVANATTTPAITIIAGAITPTSVNGLTITANGTNTLNITAGKTLTVQDNVTITGALGTGAYATIANYLPLAGGTMTGDILGAVSYGATGTRITKLWATNVEITNLPTINGGTLATALSLSGTNSGDNATNSTYTTLATTIATANTWSAAQTFTKVIQTVTPMGAQALDGTLGNVFTRTLAGDEVFTQSGFTAGQCFMVEVTAVHIITWFAGITWITTGATKPTQGAITIYGFRCTGANTFIGMLVATQ
jgi:hypothetical protein